ncbi:LicD family protein [Candidatus Tisiphia endosymbiont of Dascillus cervinus]|uniref:LicD family protein n=1 Tax=Candidatus Tisiphia endosymbiont of Dascillus cervinus TaxID=3066253 RepID=UPI00312CBDE1
MHKNHKKTNNFFFKIAGVIIITYGLYLGYVEFYDHQWRYVTPTDQQVQKYTISENKALSLYQLMKDTHEILTKHNIQYWITSGTLLGTARHKGLIPYDDDLDIAIMHADEIRLQDILTDFVKLGYKTYHQDFYTICNKVCIDIFIFRPKDNMFIYANFRTLRRFPNDFFYIDEVFPLKKYKFGEIEVYGPHEFKGNLDRQYPEWDKYGIIQQPHSYFVTLSPIEQKTKFILTPKLLKPAMPTGPLEDRVIPKLLTKE